MTNQKPASSKKSDPYTGLLSVLIGILSLACLGIWGLALYHAGYLPGISTLMKYTATPVTANENLSCQNLINQAMLVSGNHCDHIGPNQVCYGNVTIQADLIPDAKEHFANIGDVVDIQLIQRLSTAPLDLQKNEWGIAVFNIIANLPRSLPGEAVKMVVFGNTTLGNNGMGDVQSFYFSSELGQIVCDKVPFDGIMITMPDGAGVKLVINGSELMLMGNASLRAVKNGTMDVSLYSGTASITADNQTQYFGAGQKVQVPLGGANGTDAAGPPSQPIPLSTQEVDLACTLSGISCPSANSIPTINPQDAQATLNSTPNGAPVPTVGVTQTPVVSNPTVPPTNIVPATPPPTSQIQPTPKPVNTKNTPPGQIKKTPKPTNSHSN